MGILAHHPRSVALHDALGPSAVLHAVLPIWRRHGFARTDWAGADQTFALHALVTGTALALLGPTPGPVPAADPMTVLGAAVTAILGPEVGDQQDTRAAATEITDVLRTGQTAALWLISAPDSTAEPAR